MTGTVLVLAVVFGGFCALLGVGLAIASTLARRERRIEGGKISDAWRDEHFGNRRDE